MEQLQGKTVVITGASSGIGAAIAKELAAEGANVVLAARRHEKLNEIEKEINRQARGKAFVVRTDMANREEVEEMVKKRWKHLDVLIFLSITRARCFPPLSSPVKSKSGRK